MGLSFRVRNGTGRAPHALAADRWAAPTVTVIRCLFTCPGGRMAHRKDDSGASSCPDRAWALVPRAARCGSGRARAISAARLRTSPSLHLPSIDQVVYLGLPEGELIPGTASRLDAFSGYPRRTRLPYRAVGRQPVHRRCVHPGPLVLGAASIVSCAHGG